jgi:preprotein translocase subunit SecG
MYTILTIIASIVAILLIITVLLQSSKGGGLAGTFGGAQMGTMFGTRRTADFLSRATWWLGGTLTIIAIVTNLFFLPGQTTADQRESIIQRGNRRNVPQTPTLPQQRPQQTPPQTQQQPK